MKNSKFTFFDIEKISGSLLLRRFAIGVGVLFSAVPIYSASSTAGTYSAYFLVEPVRQDQLTGRVQWGAADEYDKSGGLLKVKKSPATKNDAPLIIKTVRQLATNMWLLRASKNWLLVTYGTDFSKKNCVNFWAWYLGNTNGVYIPPSKLDKYAQPVLDNCATPRLKGMLELWPTVKPKASRRKWDMRPLLAQKPAKTTRVSNPSNPCANAHDTGNWNQQATCVADSHIYGVATKAPYIPPPQPAICETMRDGVAYITIGYNRLKKLELLGKLPSGFKTFLHVGSKVLEGVDLVFLPIDIENWQKAAIPPPNSTASGIAELIGTLNPIGAMRLGVKTFTEAGGTFGGRPPGIDGAWEERKSADGVPYIVCVCEGGTSKRPCRCKV